MKNYFWQLQYKPFQDQPLDFFTLSDIEKDHIVTNHRSHNQVIYALILKYFESQGRFPDSNILTECSSHVLNILAEQLNIPFDCVEWPAVRTLNRFRVNIRMFLGYREISNADKSDLSSWLFKNVLPHAPDEDLLFGASIFFCRQYKIELFAKNEMDRFLASVAHAYEEDLFSRVANTLSNETKEKLEQLLEEASENDLETSEIRSAKHPTSKFVLNDLKKDTSQLKKQSILYEINKYMFLKKLILPEEIYCHPRKLLLKYAVRIKGMFPSHMRTFAPNTRYTQLAFFCAVKTQQSADTLTDMLLKILGRIQKRAERHVDQYALSEIKKVKGKFDTLLMLAETLKENPKGIIEQEVYPKVPAAALDAIIKELHHRQKWYQNQVRVKALSLYRNGYRKVVKNLLEALTFATDRKDLRELIQAVEWVKTNEGERLQQQLPYEAEVLKSWGPLVQKGSDQSPVSMDLNAYELAVLGYFSTELSVKNIWVQGSYRYQSPSKDTPFDFDARKDFYFEWLGLPKSADVFVNSLKEALEKSLIALNETLPDNDKVILVERKKGCLKLSPPSPQDAPKNLNILHQDISNLCPNLAMIDILKEVDFLVGFTKNFKTVGFRNALPTDVLQKRLLLCLYGLGTNVGLKRLSTTYTGEAYGDLRYVRTRYMNASHMRSAIQDVVNAVLQLRNTKIWGDNIVGCACDSKRFNVWEQNLFGAWHGRYRAHGVMVYTHIDTKSTPIYMQVTRPGDSEVGAMLSGCINHDTDMDMNEIYTDTHGQSCIGFAFSHLLQFDLFPRIKGIHKQKLFVPSKALKEQLPHLKLILASEPINWNKIKDNYEDFVKHTAALKTKSVEVDVLLKRMSAGNAKDPVYQALLEIGKAKRTLFLCRYLSDESFRIDINEALNMVERFNGLMGFIFHGRHGEIASNDKEEQELSILAMHLIQVCIVYMNTLIIQEILTTPSRSYVLGEEDLRALTPLIHSHINPHGVVLLDMTKRLNFKINPTRKVSYG